jgi:hypothetical protein
MMVFAVLHSANTECCGSRLLKPDADIILAQTCSLLAAAVHKWLCGFRIFKKHFALATCAQTGTS